MQRLKNYCGILAWQTGIGYLMLWAVTYWTLAYGAAVFGPSGVCHAYSTQMLFYWACDPTSPLEILAGVVNFALTTTVWAPVFIAAATVNSDAVIIALPIIAIHAVGLPLGILVLTRLLARTFDTMRALRCRIRGIASPTIAAGGAVALHPPSERHPIGCSDRAQPAPT